MKIVGTGALHMLATGNHPDVAGAAAALRAELSSACWSDVDAVKQTYPRAEFVGHRIWIALPVEHCVVIAVNFVAGVVMIEFAGVRDDAPRGHQAKGRKAA